MKTRTSFRRYMLSCCSVVLLFYTPFAHAEKAWVNADSLNLRAKPSISADRVAKLVYNSQCEVLKTNPAKVVIDNKSGQWANVKCAGKTGWVFNAFLADHDLFVSRANALLASIRAKKPLASFVAKGGFTYNYSSYDRCEGSTEGNQSLKTAAAIDKPFKVKLNGDGKGWMEGEGCSAKTYYSDVLIAKEARELLQWDGNLQVDGKTFEASIENDYSGLVFQFKAVGKQFVISKIRYFIEDPG